MWPCKQGSWKILLFAIGFVSLNARGGEDGPADAWARAYSWLQTGERLASGEQWSLAMGSFIESHRQMKEIRESHPQYEPEMLAYRVGRLEEMITETQAKLPPGGTAITAKFLDFIESYDEGMKLRFENRFVEALNTLDVARVILDEIIFENPDEFRDAVNTQYEFLHSSLGWLDQQINYKERARRTTYVSDGTDWGTTKYVKESDLPGEGDSIFTSAALFPGLPAPEQVSDLRTIPGNSASGSTEPPDESGADETAEGPGNGLPAFRMSSKQKSDPEVDELPQGEDQ